MESPMTFSQRPHYHNCGHTTSNQDEEERWFMVHVKIDGKDLTIHIYPDDFERSPMRLYEFNRYLESLQSGSWDEWPSDVEDKAHGDDEMPTQAATLDLTLARYCEWATSPFFSMLEEITPRLSEAETITLEHFLSGESFEANLEAVDDVLVPSSIQTSNGIDSEPGIPWKTAFPIFQARKVEVLSDDPTRVWVRGKELFFKAFQDPDNSNGVKEILTLKKIYKASLNQKQICTSHLYGVVEDVKLHVISLLLHYIQVDDTLYGKINESGSLDISVKDKDKWKRWVKSTVEALHVAGIFWGNSKASNILVDIGRDAWVVNFGDGYTVGWVESSSAGIITGDLLGLWEFIDFADIRREPGQK